MKTKWTQFMDMASGGGTKEKNYSYIYIEAPEQEAKVIFYNRFGHSPDRVSCTCCGSDYSITESDSLEEATAYNRGCAYSEKLKKWVDEPDTEKYAKKYLTLPQYIKDEGDSILIVRADDIKASERVGEVPEQGYVWQN